MTVKVKIAAHAANTPFSVTSADVPANPLDGLINDALGDCLTTDFSATQCVKQVPPSGSKVRCNK
jgi:hypothetical protein